MMHGTMNIKNSNRRLLFFGTSFPCAHIDEILQYINNHIYTHTHIHRHKVNTFLFSTNHIELRSTLVSR